MRTRYAKVKGPEKAVRAYLPENYHVVGREHMADGDYVIIAGVDNAGWTLDDYVLPRLASGLYFGEELIEPPVQLATFEIEMTVVDMVGRKRWNGDPMASREANEALFALVEQMQETARELGFVITHTGYGVLAREIECD